MSNIKDLSVLSYKELQSLAIENRVPGNIKKSILVKIIHAAKNGDRIGARQLITDVKKNRKKKKKLVKKVNVQEKTQLPLLHSFDLHQQNQWHISNKKYPLKWITNEIGACNFQDFSHKIDYNDKQYKSNEERNFKNYDINHEIMDKIIQLKTRPVSVIDHYNIESNYCKDVNSYSQDIYDADNDYKMSELLKKMLQAPAGTNLGDIASPISRFTDNDYQRPRRRSVAFKTNML